MFWKRAVSEPHRSFIFHSNRNRIKTLPTIYKLLIRIKTSCWLPANHWYICVFWNPIITLRPKNEHHLTGGVHFLPCDRIRTHLNVKCRWHWTANLRPRGRHRGTFEFVTNKTRNECHSDRRNVSRGIYSSSKFYFVLVPSPTWWIPPLRWRSRPEWQWGYVSTDSPIVYATFCAAPPPSSVSPTGRASFPTGEAFVPCHAAHRLNLTLLYPKRPPERHTGRSLRFRWWGYSSTDAVQKRSFFVPFCWNWQHPLHQ